MTLVKRNAFLPTFFNDFFDNNDWNFGVDHRPVSRPSINVVDSKDAYRLEVAAPGMSKESFEVSVNNNVLTIKGSVKADNTTEKAEERYTLREFTFNSFERSFRLPLKHVDEEHITATYTDGILHVTVPKKEEAKPKPVRSISIG